MPTTKQIQLINKQEFAIAILDGSFKLFIVYIAALQVLKPAKIIVYLSQVAQIVE